MNERDVQIFAYPFLYTVFTKRKKKKSFNEDTVWR